MANKCVVFYTNNAAIIDIINQQTSNHPLGHDFSSQSSFKTAYI